ncbi:hypothetical protein H0A61_00774 [Koleobacter methoxysyntrophicus]|uniref:Dockerin domain-containing protein n=1 Tax=Koleobacter methoxysyntrophicus TaxID=2751313 RepID=A0A8A0RKP3_9FIRM|nr:S-layer homology domain-containing protein [Koleobacter methoxysyntrophicus]QSQ08452.1 hypothetical protein H0A61_00774 [Koleobacter methoxysyntrophicus]
MNVGRFLSLVVLFSLLMSWPFCLPAKSGGNAKIEFSTPEYISKDTFSIEVMIKEVYNLYGFSAELQYNPEMLIVEEITSGDFISGDFIHQDIDNTAGRGLYVETRTGKTPGISGDGSMLKITLRALGSAAVDIDKIFKIELADDEGQVIPFELVPLTIDIDIEEPSLWIAPLPTRTNEANLIICGGYTGNMAWIKVNELDAEIDRKGKTFCSEITLKEGENIIQIRGEDPSGNSYTLQETVILDILPPLIHIDYPEDGVVVYTDSVEVRGMIEDEGFQNQLFIDGNSVPLNDGAFETIITLESCGAYTITLKAVDQAGNSSERNITVNFIYPDDIGEGGENGGNDGQGEDDNSERKDNKRRKTHNPKELKEVPGSKNKEPAMGYYTDIEGHWAAEYIKELRKAGILTPEGAEAFMPDRGINDREFVDLLTRVIHFYREEKDYSGEFIDAGMNKGILITGRLLKRYDMALITARVLNLKGEGNPPYFIDFHDIPGELSGVIEAVSEAGLMIGFDDMSFGGERIATRAQGAAVALRALRYLQKSDTVIEKLENKGRWKILSQTDPLIIENPPGDVTFTTEGTVLLKGSVQPGYSLKINGIEQELTEGRFNVIWPLNGGIYYKNKIEFSYYREGVKEGSKTIWVVMDEYPPNIEENGTVPEEGEYISSWSGRGLFPVTLSISDFQTGISDVSFEVELNGVPSTRILEIKQGSVLGIEVITGMKKGFDVGYLQGLPDGRYLLAGRFSDNAGNSGLFTREFTIDTLEPFAQITFPDNGQTISGQITVTGSVYDANIKEYRLEVGPGETPASWELSAAGDINIEDGEMGVIDTTRFADGPATMRLTVVDMAGNTGSAEILVVIENLSSQIPLTLSGQAVLQARGGAEGIHVCLETGEGEVAVYSDRDGGFVFEGLEPGIYTLRVSYAGYKACIEEVDLRGEQEIQKFITLKAGDIDGNGTIDKADLMMFMSYFSLSQSEPGWDARLDFVEDGTINICDLVLIAKNIE